MQAQRGAGFSRRELIIASGAAAAGLCGCGGIAWGEDIPPEYAPCRSPDPTPEQSQESRELSTNAKFANVEHNESSALAGVMAAPGGGPSILGMRAPQIREHLPKSLNMPLPQLEAAHTPDMFANRGALSLAKIWKKGLEITVAFLRQNAFMQGIFEEAIGLWNEQLAPTKLSLVGNAASAMISVGFLGDGHWSLLGTDSLSRSMRQQRGGRSLNVQPSTDKRMMLGITLHELGHALGLIHEHQNPTDPIPWNERAVIDFYKRTQGWSDQEIYWNVLGKSTYERIHASGFDVLSIMLYPLHRSLLNQAVTGWQKFESKWNFALSDKDKELIREKYGPGDVAMPPADKPPTSEARTLAVGTPLDGEFKTYGQVDAYKIEIPAEDDYLIETTENPATHVVLWLTKNDGTPEGEGTHLNGRRTLNAAMTKRLPKGTTYLRAAHRHRAGTGKYTLLVSASR